MWLSFDEVNIDVLGIYHSFSISLNKKTCKMSALMNASTK